MKHGHKKEKINKKLFFIVILKRLKTKQKERRKVRDKALFQKKENKGAFHQTLQNISVSDREAHFSDMITQT